MHGLQRHPFFRQLRAVLGGLPRRGWLTLRHLGPREFGHRLVILPGRLLPSRRPAEDSAMVSAARGWYAKRSQPVAIVIATYGDPSLVKAAVRSIRATTRRSMVRVIVADDGSDRRHLRRLRRIRGIELVEGSDTRGFAANCNRGIDRLRAGEDLVLLNSDVIAHESWLEGLQYTAYRARDAGIVGPKLLYADGTIQSAGSVRNADAPEWFDHRYRFKPASHPPANVVAPCLATTGAAMYVRRECLEAIGGRFDEAYGMAFEDTDWCLRAWDAGWRVYYCPFSTLTHLESKTRGMVQGERELASQRLFWERWRAWLDERAVTDADGGLRIVYVSEDTGVGGGHRVVFQHLVALQDAGHHVELWSLGERPGWFDLGDIPVRSFASYLELEAALEPIAAIKVATWWVTAETVWPASVRHGIPAYFVQDIETSYYDHDPGIHGRILDSYRLEFHYLTTSGWNAERLREMHIAARVAPPGIDPGRFFPRDDVERRDDVVLALGRTDPLKDFALTRSAWAALPEPRPELWLFGIEPALADAPGIRYVERPPDEQVNELLNTATVFVQTSRHEGFCLPILEAMAAGVPVVCTDADGNRDFCRDGENCLMPEPSPEAVAAAIRCLLEDAALCERLVAAGLETAAAYAWPARAADVQRFFAALVPTGAQARS
jgi:GT2 family glycosyltransferase